MGNDSLRFDSTEWISLTFNILLNIAFRKNGIEFAKEIFTELNRLNFFNFETLLNPRISIKNLTNSEDLELIKKISNRHNVNILSYR